MQPAGLRRHVPQILFTSPFQVFLFWKLLQPGEVLSHVMPDDLPAVDPVQDLSRIVPDLRQTRRKRMFPYPSLQSGEDQDVWKLFQILIPLADSLLVLQEGCSSVILPEKPDTLPEFFSCQMDPLPV